MRFRADHAIELGAPADEVWPWVVEAQRWRDLWPWVRLDTSLATPPRIAPGDRISASVPSPLGYRVRFTLRVEDLVDGRELHVAVEGDVEGGGALVLDGSALTLTWDVAIAQPLLRAAWPIARPVLTWAHDKVVERAASDLRVAIGRDPAVQAGASVRDVAAAAAVAGALAGIPSTVHALVTGRSMWAATRAAGTLLGKPSAIRGVVVHTALSIFWASVLSRAAPRPRPLLAGAAAGAAIGALDLGVVGRRVTEIRSLPQWPQMADHVAFGSLVAAVLEWRRR